ncbi:MAG: selenide, water dikinase SelD [Cyclonatronaceae bacterium]
MSSDTPVKLTQYSHGAGCGCKISPSVLQEILGHNKLAAPSAEHAPEFTSLLVGNEESDDAAVVSLDGDTAIISTTDFFMPIVDDPHDFGAIAATNAISDIYAMGGTPIMAIAILGWPIEKLSAEVAGQVLQGGREVCHRAGIPLAGGHSIDAPEPIFGLAVTGKIAVSQVKRNNTARPGDLLYLTKPLGIGLVSTAQKRGLAQAEDLSLAHRSMMQLNDIGMRLARLPFVHSMTDVTGFGLGGHLDEMCRGSNTSAVLRRNEIPLFDFAQKYLELNTIPGGTNRNWASYGKRIRLADEADKNWLADPQTSGGLLLAVHPEHQKEFETLMMNYGLKLCSFGAMEAARPEYSIRVE